MVKGCSSIRWYGVCIADTPVQKGLPQHGWRPKIAHRVFKKRGQRVPYVSNASSKTLPHCRKNLFTLASVNRNPLRWSSLMTAINKDKNSIYYTVHKTQKQSPIIKSTRWGDFFRWEMATGNEASLDTRDIMKKLLLGHLGSGCAFIQAGFAR